MDEKAKESLNKAGNICLFVKENSGDEQTARYMAEAIAAINEAVAQETVKVEQPGNAAAMRDALKRIVFGYWAARTMNSSELRLDRIARAALAAPARNCDRFQSFDEALAEFNKTHESLKFCYGELHKWLFAPAEGETK